MCARAEVRTTTATLLFGAGRCGLAVARQARRAAATLGVGLGVALGAEPPGTRASGAAAG